MRYYPSFAAHDIRYFFFFCNEPAACFGRFVFFFSSLSPRICTIPPRSLDPLGKLRISVDTDPPAGALSRTWILTVSIERPWNLSNWK